MKYLVTAQRNTLQAPSPEEWLGILKATREYLTAHLENGTFECIYIFADATSGFAVINADSHEDVTDVITAHPQYGYLDWEIAPACDTLKSYDKFIERFEQLLG
jgi:muconolactone delta-isomerase